MKDKLLNIGLLVAVVLVAIWAWTQFTSESPAIAQTRQQIAISKLQQDARIEQDRTEQLAGLTTAANAFYIALPSLLIIGLFSLAGFVAHKHFSVVRPDALGLYPVPVRELPDLARLSAIGYHEAQIAGATRQLVPQTLTHTYAPALHYKNQQEGLPAGDAQAVITAPAFAQLLATGQIGPGQPLLLGYGEQGAITGTWKDLYSSAIAGVSGSGKTTTQRFLCAQAALQGAKFCLIDPHADSGQESLAGTLAPLAAAFLREPATNDKQMLATIKYAQERLQARIKGQDSDHSPIIIAVDEFTSLVARSALSEPLAQLIEGIAQEGRKVGVFGLLSGQIWTADRSGGSALRDSLASCYVHKIRRSQARMLMGMTDRLPDTSGLPAGQAWLYRTSGELTQVSIPLTTGTDVETVGKQLGKAIAPIARPLRDPEQAMLPATVDPELLTKAARVRELASQRVGTSEIIKQVWNVPNGGDAYKKASVEYRDIIAMLLTEGQTT